MPKAAKAHTTDKRLRGHALQAVVLADREK